MTCLCLSVRHSRVATHHRSKGVDSVMSWGVAVAYKLFPHRLMPTAGTIYQAASPHTRPHSRVARSLGCKRHHVAVSGPWAPLAL